jgi:hypothetical protein
MKKIPPPFILLLGALVFAGALAIMDRDRGPHRAQPAEKNSFAAENTRSVAAGSAASSAAGKTAGLSPAFGGLERRDVDEVFPDGGPRGSNWRNGHPHAVRVAPYPGITLTHLGRAQ